MTCFTSSQSASIIGAISALKARMLKVDKLELTHDQFLSLLATREEQKILRAAEEVADVSGFEGYAEVEFRHSSLRKIIGENKVDLHVKLSSTGGKTPPLRPRNKVIRADADPELLEQLTLWVTERIKVGFAFAKARALFDWFDNNCASRSTVRFYWPTIIALADMGEAKDLATRLLEVKPPRTAPALPPEVRMACRETAGTIAVARLLPEAESSVPPPALVSLYSASAVDGGALGMLSPE